MEGLSRYEVPDAYILEELKRDYQSSDVRGRIRLLKKLRFPPYEIARMAVEDPHVEVRQWIARNGEKLDYDESNLGERLKNDPDPFVRACLRENPDAFGVVGLVLDSKELFQEATHLERLALVRNPSVPNSLIEKIFNMEDNELGISIEQRKELALAFLSNREALEKNAIVAGLNGEGGSLDALTHLGACRFFETLWGYSSKWPKKSSIRHAVFKSVPTEDEVKAKVYASCKEGFLRGAILENCSHRDRNTLDLGMKDSDGTCRMIAYSRIGRVDPKDFEVKLKSKDTDALSGLAENKSLPVEQLERVASRLSELNDDMGWASARRTIRQREGVEAPDDPEALFGWAGREGNFLEGKVDFIGKKLIALEEKWEERLKKIENTTGKLYEGAKSLVLVAWVAIIVLAAWWLLRALWRFVAGFL